MSTNASAEAPLERHTSSCSKGTEAAHRHISESSSSPAVKILPPQQQQQHPHPQPSVRSLGGLGASNLYGPGGRRRAGAPLMPTSRANPRPSRGMNWDHGVNGGGGPAHRDPCANGGSGAGRLTPTPLSKTEKAQVLAADASAGGVRDGVAGAAAITDVDCAASSEPVQERDVEEKLPQGKVGNKGGLSSPNGATRDRLVAANQSNHGNHYESPSKTTVEAAALTVEAARDNGGQTREKSSTVAVKQDQGQVEHQQQHQSQHHASPSKVEPTVKVHHERCAPEALAAAAPAPVASAAPANCSRPAVALSVHLVALYKRVNEAYCRKRRMEVPGPKYNNGFDDKEGHYLVLSGEEIFNRYTVQEVLGKGSFGTVLRCIDEKRRENVALKITRHGLSFRTQAKLELDILLKLNTNPNLNHLVVKLLKVFDWQGHLVLVFELLSFNLYQLIKCTRYHGVTLDLVRKFAYQLVQCLYQLEQVKPSPIIHCDIKPENILLKNQNRSGIRLIDFGSACYLNKVVHRYIQSRYYRSPEVIMYLEYGTAIDRWSLACVLIELHTGMPPFDGRTEAAQLARFEAMLGPMPVDMLEASPKTAKLFEKTDSGYRLKEPPLPKRSLESVLGVTTGGPRGSRKGQPGHSEEAYRQFQDFLSRLLQYRPSERMSCHDALRHPFLEPLWVSDQQLHHHRAQQQQQQQKPEELLAVPQQPQAPPRGEGCK